MDHPPSTDTPIELIPMGRKALALCQACGTPYAGFYDEADGLHVDGEPTCPSCGEPSLREITDDEIEGGPGRKRAN